MNPLTVSALWHRRAVGILGVLLAPVLLLIGGPQESISAMYHSPARDVFVGWLALIAGALAAYRGYDAGDARCARIAAVGLLLVAYAPTGPGLVGKVHLVGALVFFGSIAALVWRFGYGSRPKTFRALSVGIVACIAWALVAGIAGGSIFAPEAIAVLLFGGAWLHKGRILSTTAPNSGL